MSEEKKPREGWNGAGAHANHPPAASGPYPPIKSARKKRRRVGQLNDGEWAPGYGPNAKKKPA